MGSFSDYLEDALLQHVFSTGRGKVDSALAVPDKYIALCTTHVDDDDTGSTITEPTTDGSYHRKKWQTWDTCSGGATANSAPITFSQATASWGTIIDFAICTALTAGEVLAYGHLTISKSVASGDTPKFATGDLDITLS